MSSPMFTIAVPTKNRPDRVRNSVRSLVEQSFGDLEVILCDNSDEPHAAATAAVVDELGDDRVRYVRTSGTLSMPDNWEHAIADARGEYVGVLTDRSVFRGNALETVHTEIEQTGALLVNWFNDLYGRTGTELKRRDCTLRRYRHSSADVLRYFVGGHPKYVTKVVPKLMTSVCHRSVLDAIRTSNGRVCPPVAPDFTSGFLMLAHTDWLLTIDESLYVSVGTGNGADFRRGGELADRFRADLGMEWHDMVSYMPSDAPFAHALVLNDLMRLRDKLPEKFSEFELNHAQYYLGCLNDYVKAARQGVRRDPELESLLTALEREPAEVQKFVKRSALYASAVTFRGVGLRIAERTLETVTTSMPTFDSVWQALAWDEANPREPIASSFMELNVPLEDIKRAPTRTFLKNVRRRLRKLIGRVPFFNRTVWAIGRWRARRRELQAGARESAAR